jgi:alpha-tubulin suppressor-like RCC1 family protein
MMHTCGITVGGDAYCWGDNTDGAIGTAPQIPFVLQPALVAGNIRFVQLSAGQDETCGIDTSAKIYCWGRGTFAPQQVQTDVKLVSITVGNGFRCGLDAAGAAYCWGIQRLDRLGTGTTADAPTPVRSRPGFVFSEMRAHAEYVCGVTVQHDAYCWGATGIGISTGLQGLVSATVKITDVAPANPHACFLSTDQRIYCVGSNFDGELGVPPIHTYFDQLVPVGPDGADLRFSLVTTAAAATCAVTIQAVPYCWGYWARLGTGLTSGNKLEPRPVLPPLP